MNAITPIASKIDLTGLLSAIAQADADDSMSNPLTPAQWDTVSAYLQPYAVPVGHVLFSQGATDRTLYLVESGSLSVHYQDEKERLRRAIVGPGRWWEKAPSFRCAPAAPRCRPARRPSCGP